MVNPESYRVMHVRCGLPTNHPEHHKVPCSGLNECLGDHALTEIRRFQMADKPPSTDNSTPFTKLESSEARNSATVAISSD
jgi:hypothetical protein